MTKLYSMYFNTKMKLKNHLKNKRGQGMVEYILIVALIGVVLIATLGDVGDAIKLKFQEVEKAIPATTTTPPPSGS